MPKIAYSETKFQAKTLKQIKIANQIVEEYVAQGFDLTVRQLYYQMVARDYIPNNQREYKKLVETVNNARLAGLIDWDHIVDRTRNLRQNSHFDDPADIAKPSLQAQSQC